MATATRVKSLLATRSYPLDASALVPVGAVVTSCQMLASRASPPLGVYPLQTTPLAQAVTATDATIHLTADVRAGAMIILDPGGGAEERLKVISTTAHAGHFDATVTPVAWTDHSLGNVSYEPGMNARLFVSSTPTPNGNILTPFIMKGAHGQKYRISYVFPLNNGETREDEFTLEVLDPSGDSEVKQPSETVFIAADLSKRLAEPHQAGATLSPGTAQVSSQLSSFTAQLTATANAGVSSLSLNANPGVGAMLILNPAGTGSNPPERVYVTAVSGTVSPFTATVVNDLEFSHNSGVDVTVFLGYSGAFLTTVNSTIQGTFAVNQARRGQAGKGLKIVWVAPTSQGEVIQVNALCSIEEL